MKMMFCVLGEERGHMTQAMAVKEMVEAAGHQVVAVTLGAQPLQSAALSDVAARLEATPMQVALAWLLQRAPNILLIPGTSSVAHLHENLAAASLTLPEEAVTELNAIG